MKHHREYEIAWQGLKPGLHTYVFNIDDRFMKERLPEDGNLKDWKAQVTLNFDKKSNFFLLHFDIDGSVTAPCDRCGADFSLKLWDEFDLVVKLIAEDGEAREDEDDVVFIPRSETVIDISGWLYEFILLSVPLQKVHPDNADGSEGCDPKVIALLNDLAPHQEETVNPIWKGLEAFKKGKRDASKTKDEADASTRKTEKEKKPKLDKK